MDGEGILKIKFELLLIKIVQFTLMFIFINGCGRGSLKETQHYSDASTDENSNSGSNGGNNDNSNLTTYIWNDSTDNTQHWLAETLTGISQSLNSPKKIRQCNSNINA